MLRKELAVAGIVAAVLLGVAPGPVAQAATVGLTSAGTSETAPNQATTFEFDPAVHRSAGTDPATIGLKVASDDGSAFQSGAPLLSLSNANHSGFNRAFRPSTINRLGQATLMPLAPSALMLLTALLALLGFAWWRQRSPSINGLNVGPRRRSR